MCYPYSFCFRMLFEIPSVVYFDSVGIVCVCLDRHNYSQSSTECSTQKIRLYAIHALLIHNAIHVQRTEKWKDH